MGVFYFQIYHCIKKYPCFFKRLEIIKFVKNDESGRIGTFKIHYITRIFSYNRGIFDYDKRRNGYIILG